MAKTSGLDTRIYVEGTDLSGDVSALSGIGSNQALSDVTTLDLAATARLSGLKDGTLSCSAFFDNAAAKGHAIWTALSGKIPIADQNVFVPLGTSIGDPVLMLVSKQGTYNVDRPNGGPVSCSVDYQAANGTSPDFGKLLTGGKVSDSSGTTYSAIDNAASSADGMRAMIQSFSLVSGSATCTIQDSPDNITYGTLGTFTVVTGKTSELISVSGTVERYVRLLTSGTFSTLVLCVALTRL
tara:strand:- start:324 stop:1043 length:720 start_codon:yes stop_codon:yes gene_type:complete